MKTIFFPFRTSRSALRIALAALLLLCCAAPAARAQKVSALPRTNILSGPAASNLVLLTDTTLGTNGSLAMPLSSFAATLLPLTAALTNITTNANQFGASTTITIKDGALLTNLVARGLTNFGAFSNSGPLDVGGTISAPSLLVPGIVTNNPNTWVVWSNPQSTNRYFAENRGVGVKLASDDFAAMFQSVVNQLRDGGHILVHANPVFTNGYVFSNTVVITNMSIIEGFGNPSTIFRAAPGLAGPILQIGDATHLVSGINRINRIRFEGDQGAATCVGVKVVNTAEPVFEFCEWTGFKFAGLQFSVIDYVHWAFASHCWFVLKDAGSHGILFDREPTTLGQNHFTINDCIFGVAGAGEGMITVSNLFPNLRVINNHFRVLSGGLAYGFGAYAGKNFTIFNNEFVNFSSPYPVVFYDRLAATNYQSIVAFNKTDTPNVTVLVGDFIQGNSYFGNKNPGGIDNIFFTGNNGAVNNYDEFEILAGHLTPSRAAIIDSTGRITNAFAASPASSLVKADGSTASVSNHVVSAFGALTITNRTAGAEFTGSRLIETNGFNFSAKHGWLSTNLQWRLVKMGTLTNVVDVSAAAYYPSNNTFFTVHNNNSGRITEWTLDGVFLRNINGSGSGLADVESITYIGGNKFAIVEEDLNNIYVISITNNAAGSTWTTNNSEMFELPTSIGVDGSGSGVEGIAYDWDRRLWWIAKEKAPAQLLIVTNQPGTANWFTNNWFTTAQMQTFTNTLNTDFSDIFLDRENQVLWVAQDEGGQADRVIGISLITSNIVSIINATNFGQLEGVSITPDGYAILAGEANQFAIYEPVIGGLNSGISWNNFVRSTNTPALPSFNYGASVGPFGVYLTNWFATNITLDFPVIEAQSETNLQFSLAWAANDYEVTVTPPAYTAGVIYSGQPSNGVIYVRGHNYSTTTKDPASGGFRVVVKGWR